jgi:hypothetical protein
MGTGTQAKEIVLSLGQGPRPGQGRQDLLAVRVFEFALSNYLSINSTLYNI